MSLDDNALKFVLDQNLNTKKTFVQMLFDNIKKETEALKQENVDLRSSLEFSQKDISDLKTECSRLKGLLTNVNNGSNSSQSPCYSLDQVSERVRVLEDSARGKNIRIIGLEELKDENSEQTQHKVNKLIADKLKLSDCQVLKSFRAGKNIPTTVEELREKPRPIIAELSSISNKMSCLKMSKNLKGTKIYVNEDVCRATLDIRLQKMDLLKKKREEGCIAYFSGVNIVSKPRSAVNLNAQPQISGTGGSRNLRSRK